MKERAKEIYLEYGGNHFQIDRSEVGPEYRSYQIPKETEEEWKQEYIRWYMTAETEGRQTLSAYAKTVELMMGEQTDETWSNILHAPFTRKDADDVTVLYMLQRSYILAEQAYRKKRLGKEETETYLQELQEYAADVLQRAENGTMRRSADYAPQEFSDPVYIRKYLNDLTEKWRRLV